jgi:regulator of cell morphogenesis and NO signaling
MESVNEITKMTNETNQETLGEIVARDIRKGLIFKKYGLDFCCGGKKTIQEACEAKGIDSAPLVKELIEADNVKDSRPLPYNEWSLDFLVDYIVNTHHSYVEKTLPEMRAYADKVMRAHGNRHPELLEIRQLVEAVFQEMTEHMFKEEKILFPYIKQLEAAGNRSAAAPAAHFGSVQNPIYMMEAEHESAGHAMAQIRKLTQDYNLPQGACMSYKLLYHLLEEFENDLHVHVHLENNILFPKSVMLENQCHSASASL